MSGDSEDHARAVASEMTFTWGPSEKRKSIRRISLEVISAQAQLIGALQIEAGERELRLMHTEMERDTNLDRIKELESDPDPEEKAP